MRRPSRGFRSFRNDSYTPPTLGVGATLAVAHFHPQTGYGQRQALPLQFAHIFLEFSHESRRRVQGGHVL